MEVSEYYDRALNKFEWSLLSLKQYEDIFNGEKLVIVASVFFSCISS